MAGPLPGGALARWTKFLLQKVPWIDIGLQYAVQYIDNLYVSSDPSPTEWRRMQVIFQRTAEGLPADKMVTTFDFVNFTGGQVDNSWTQADHDTLHSHFDTFWNGAVKQFVSPTLLWVETRMYRMQFATLPNIDPVTKKDKPFQLSGEPVAIYSDAVAGTAGGSPQAPQIALSTTDRTAYRRHWGRNYWPGISSEFLTTTGSHFLPATVDAMGNGLSTFYGGLWDLEYIPVTPVAQIGHAPARGLLSVNEIQVDDVPDVIRRRRPRTTTHTYITP